MDASIRDISRVTREYFLNSYDFLKRKYKRQHAIKDIENFENFPEIMLQNLRALFVLSTGRCGTDFLNHVLKKFEPLDVHHEGDSKFAIASRYLYDHSHEISQRGGELAFLAGRHHALQDAYLFNKIYIETNNRLTFFAPFILSVLPHVRFIHLVRHPGEFVRSGMRRGYYTAHSIADYTKIRPKDTDEAQGKWAKYSRVEKISWLWYRTNKFIEKIKLMHPEKVLFIKSEQLFNDTEQTVSLISEFAGFDAGPDIEINVGPKNMQRAGHYPHYQNWSNVDKNAMKTITGELAAKYNYHL